jgi:transposase-like protein
MRRWDTRVGSIDLRIPKLRTSSYFPDWLLDARTRSERAFIQVVAEVEFPPLARQFGYAAMVVVV